MISSWIMEKPRLRVIEEPKPVSFIEAWKALEEGKEIESAYTRDRYKKDNGLVKIHAEGITNFTRCGSVTIAEIENLWIIL